MAEPKAIDIDITAPWGLYPIGFIDLPGNQPQHVAEKGGNLVTVNDYFGIVAAVTDVGICIAKVPELSEKAYESFQKRPPESASGVDLRITPIHQPVSHISFNSDGTVLACVSGRDIMIYETSSLWHHPGQARPFQTITHHESEDIVDLKFNPGNFCDASITWWNSFVVATSSSLSLYQVNGNSLTYTKTKATTTKKQLTSLSWSWYGSKGKQFLTAYSDGSFDRRNMKLEVTYQPMLSQQPNSSEPKYLGSRSYDDASLHISATGICWLKPYSFFIRHGVGENASTAFILSSSSSSAESKNHAHEPTIQYDTKNILEAGFTERPEYLYSYMIAPWDVMVATTSNCSSLEIFRADAHDMWMKVEPPEDYEVLLDDVPLGFGVSLHRFKLLQGFSRSSHNKSDSQSKLIPGPMFFVSTVSVTGENLKLSIFTLINTEHTDSTEQLPPFNPFDIPLSQIIPQPSTITTAQVDTTKETTNGSSRISNVEVGRKLGGGATGIFGAKSGSDNDSSAGIVSVAVGRKLGGGATGILIGTYNGDDVYQGPQGGQYRVNDTGKKTYLKEKIPTPTKSQLAPRKETTAAAPVKTEVKPATETLSSRIGTYNGDDIFGAKSGSDNDSSAGIVSVAVGRKLGGGATGIFAGIVSAGVGRKLGGGGATSDFPVTDNDDQGMSSRYQRAREKIEVRAQTIRDFFVDSDDFASLSLQLENPTKQRFEELKANLCEAKRQMNTLKVDMESINKMAQQSEKTLATRALSLHGQRVVVVERQSGPLPPIFVDLRQKLNCVDRKIQDMLFETPSKSYEDLEFVSTVIENFDDTVVCLQQRLDDLHADLQKRMDIIPDLYYRTASSFIRDGRKASATQSNTQSRHISNMRSKLFSMSTLNQSFSDTFLRSTKHGLSVLPLFSHPSLGDAHIPLASTPSGRNRETSNEMQNYGQTHSLLAENQFEESKSDNICDDKTLEAHVMSPSSENLTKEESIDVNGKALKYQTPLLQPIRRVLDTRALLASANETNDLTKLDVVPQTLNGKNTHLLDESLSIEYQDTTNNEKSAAIAFASKTEVGASAFGAIRAQDKKDGGTMFGKAAEGSTSIIGKTQQGTQQGGSPSLF
eukprot:gene6956-9572_t